MGVLSYTTLDGVAGIAGVAACASAGANNVAPVIPASANVSNSLFTGFPPWEIDAAGSRPRSGLGASHGLSVWRTPEWGGSRQRIGDERDGPLALGLKTYVAMM